MKLLNLATVYVYNEDQLLLIQRVGSRVFQGMIWSGIGGHFEGAELNDPYKCVLRELHEETGLTDNDIIDLSLRYITIRKAGAEIRQQYIFFAHLKNQEKGVNLKDCDEGELKWVSSKELFDRKMSFTNEACLRHYCRQGMLDKNVYVGSVFVEGDKPCVNWVPIKDFSTKH